MKKTASLLLAFAFAALFAGPLTAQQNRPSPTATVDAKIAGHSIKIVYARPYTKNPRSDEMRKVWDGLVPYGKVWRTGANEATIITTDVALKIDGKTIPAGSYTLWSVPTATGGELVFNKQTGQWGTQYDASQDLVRVPMKRAAHSPAVHQFEIKVEPSGNGGVIQLIWEDAAYSTAFTF